MATIIGELNEETGEMVLVQRQTIQKFWVDRTGKYLLSTVDGTETPEGGIEVPFGPDQHADQIWDFDTETWGPSTYVATAGENDWRIAEMLAIPDEIAKVEDDDPDAIGTVEDWRNYRKALRLWVEGKPGFPFGTRPISPRA